MDKQDTQGHERQQRGKVCFNCGVGGCLPPQGRTILLKQSTIVPPVLRFNIELATSPTFVDLVWGDETTHGGIHVVSFLALLQAGADSGRHSTYEVESGVCMSAGGCGLMALADEVGDPTH
jgi:hypothetical protein